MSLASLPWYDLPEVRSATDDLWAALASVLRALGLKDVPDSLERRRPFEEQWRDPSLLLSQACGYDVLYLYRDQLQVVGTPTYSAYGCHESHYRSFIVVPKASPFVRLEQTRGSRCAINSRTSHSGMNCLRALTARLQIDRTFFSEVVVTGSHEVSLHRVARGTCDVAAIDCVTYDILRRHRSETVAATRILQQTPSAPSPPFVTSKNTSPEDVDKLRQALEIVCARKDLESLRRQLTLESVRDIPLQSYQCMDDLRALAARLEYTDFQSPSPPSEPDR